MPLPAPMVVLVVPLITLELIGVCISIQWLAVDNTEGSEGRCLLLNDPILWVLLTLTSRDGFDMS